ncbi:toxin HicA [Candidatus Roizmanbacteria bacterium CG_4_10_14_0_2_um_filter_36_9]|uniref:Toxin HicA n=1 Tax=Candidatus Roizmanbacteria bacterium CG_4_10_14_0_2_um_filter_36_9 TaxID=1974823 RepID=A0A2M7U675_9BACT|nr:MAG: toxin HicA [Candidatus Roizmanbacteria bacterium CG_4_10_14_0_2_um_filter_36_9]
MPKLPILTSRQVVKILKKKGFEPVRQTGSHLTFNNRLTRKITVVPIHSDDIAKGTMKSIIKQAGLSIGDFIK